MPNFLQDNVTGAFFVQPVLIIDADRDELFKRMDAMELNGGLRVDTYTFTEHPDGNGGTFTLYAAVILVPTEAGKALAATHNSLLGQLAAGVLETHNQGQAYRAALQRIIDDAQAALNATDG